MQLRNVSLTLSVGVLLAACGGAPSASEIGDSVADATVELVKQAQQAQEFASTSPGLGALGGATAALGQAGAPLAPIRPVLEALNGRAAKVAQAMKPGAGRLPGLAGEQGEPTGEDLARFLREQIFTRENEESRSGDTVVFRIEGEDVCVERVNGEFVPAGAECEAEVDQFELRIQVVRKDGGLEFTLLLGPDRHGPVALFLSEELVALTVDLAAAKGAIVYVGEVTGQAVEVAEVMEGKLQLAAKKLGEEHYALELAVLTAVKVEQPVNGAKVLLTTAAKDPVLKLEFDAVAEELTFALDLGATDLGVPLQDAHPEATVQGLYLTHLGGASFSFTANATDTEVTVSDLGLGNEQTFQALDGTKLISFDLNRNDGRRFSLTAREGVNEPELQVTPKLDLQIIATQQPLVDAGVPLDSWEISETLGITFDGTAPKLTSTPYDDLTGTGGDLAVLSGQLRLTAQTAPALTVNPGQCLVYVGSLETDPHPFEEYAVQDCL